MSRDWVSEYAGDVSPLQADYESRQQQQRAQQAFADAVRRRTPRALLGRQFSEREGEQQHANRIRVGEENPALGRLVERTQMNWEGYANAPLEHGSATQGVQQDIATAIREDQTRYIVDESPVGAQPAGIPAMGEAAVPRLRTHLAGEGLLDADDSIHRLDWGDPPQFERDPHLSYDSIEDWHGPGHGSVATRADMQQLKQRAYRASKPFMKGPKTTVSRADEFLKNTEGLV